MTDSHFLNDLNDLDLNDRFPVFQLPSNQFSCFHSISAIKFRQKIDRTYCITATYSFSHIESCGKSLHSARKCCIFAPAIERTAFCALLGSSLKTNAGHK